MEDKQEFKIDLIEEETKGDRVVSVSIEEMPNEDKATFDCQEIKEDLIKEIDEEKRISAGNIKANLNAKKPIKEYVYGSIFGALAIGSILIGFLLDGYRVVGIICFVLAGLASYAMFKTIMDAKKIQSLLDTGKCKTIDELMVELKSKKKYEFLRNLGGMIRAGYVVGYEVIGDNEIRKVN